MARVMRFSVVPQLPEPLEPLRAVAHNMAWCWDPEAIELFFRIDTDLWVRTNQNPVRLLGEVDQDRLQALAHDKSFLVQLDRVASRLDDYVNNPPWRERNPDAPEDLKIVYLSAEFGVHESISIYSGGLGVLAGDHLKSASDLGLPLIGVGLLYREGYHRQYLNADGWQQEQYPRNDFYNMALTIVKDADGKQMVIDVDYPERTVKARIWRCLVGRVPLYLLDTDFEDNEMDDREITARLYGGDRDTRIRQEIMLGMGGIRAINAMMQAPGEAKYVTHPTVYHMNEGHAAFMTLERVKNLIESEKLEIDHALEVVKAASVFTTHTPVPAGNDMFAPEMVHYYFNHYCDQTGMPMERLLALGRVNPQDPREPFCMTVLALNLSSHANGVSKLHGEVARNMWMRNYAGVPENEVPITSITNGIHTRFWISRDMGSLFDRYLGPHWVERPDDPTVWEGIDGIPDAELWRTHERRRERLVNFVRRRLASQLRRRGAPQAEILAAGEALDPEVLTIGFARRFATYKRATLFLMNEERLKRLLTDPKRPIQMIVAGKAHPQDIQGKELIRRIVHFARGLEVRRIVFVEDYDINVARYMVAGVDCWLNTPRRPMEASGTSGMKAAANGAMNISIPDGWWCEAADLAENGWSIGRGESYTDPDEQDLVESEMLYEILEREVVPAFYNRGRDGLPRTWIARMKNAIRTICPVFNTHRMVQEYADRFYIPCAERRTAMRVDKRVRSRKLMEWKRNVARSWEKVHFVSIDCGATEGLKFGTELPVTAVLSLDGLTPDDVEVEIYFGELDAHGRIPNGTPLPMSYTKAVSDGQHAFEGAIPCNRTGQLAFTVRAIPKHPDLSEKHETGRITWA